ncbi:MAG TPA: ABC transporter substrate-binding protein [Candidatus Methylomirabilis sp.]|nr:ABC transporter substrate-binding protein [Candidatus Methylomirabilis sp.]
MGRPVRTWILTVLLALAAWALPAVAAERPLLIGYLELEGDPRYEERRIAAHFPAQPWGRPFDGARVALEESDFAGAAAGVKFEIRRAAAGDADGLLGALRRLSGAGARYFLLDAPGDAVAALAQRTRGRDLLLFNLTALGDRLRQEACQPHLFHVAPNHAMLMDGLAQFLVTKKWRQALVLKGSGPEDADLYAAFQRAAKRFGVTLVDTRPFILGRDPRERAQNNVALLTAGADYDVVIVADADGEFARDVPYQVQKPRPVVGAAGLVPDWWHWAWERHGAPQLNNRFARLAKRPMTGYDWSAWMAVKAIVDAVLRTKSLEPRPAAAYLVGDQVALDGFKGNRLAFRPWDRQLRQPLLLTTGDWVVERAPLDGFLHARNTLDTLGFDERESRCRP